MEQNKEQIESVLCGRCHRKTNHKILFSEQQDYGNDEIVGTYKYQVIQCQGCDTISFRKLESNSENYAPETGEPDVFETLYPERIEEKNATNIIEWRSYNELPPKVNGLYEETTRCFSQGFRILCAAGIRAIVEAVCQDKNIKKGTVTIKDKSGKTKTKISSNLEGKINNLAENDILTKSNADILHSLRYLGNEALHELEVPSTEELSLALGIIIHILDDIYKFPLQKKALKNVRDKAGKKT
ncbi:MAG: DUF4145 domain-containing protein [Planctomycetaceae bacterium]|jgi:hypothetical protein|nr:DUF4145 domain-containing protein [Planctomycetaceae bacterium]